VIQRVAFARQHQPNRRYPKSRHSAASSRNRCHNPESFGRLNL
jgi:hypothetical protein